MVNLKNSIISLIFIVFLAGKCKSYEYDYDYDEDYKVPTNTKRIVDQESDSDEMARLKKLEDEYLNSLKPKSSNIKEERNNAYSKDGYANSYSDPKMIEDLIKITKINKDDLNDFSDQINMKPGLNSDLGMNFEQNLHRRNNFDHSFGRPHGNGMDHGGNDFKKNQALNNMNNSSNQGWAKSSMFSFLYEIMALLFFAGLIYRCVYGRENFDDYMTVWYKNNKELMQERFQKELYYFINPANNQQIDCDENKQENNPILREGPMLYSYYAEDGGFVKSLSIKFDIRKNQDSMFMMTNFLFNQRDRIIYEFILNPDEAACPSIFMFCKTKEANYLKRANKDIDQICHIKKYYQHFDKECLAENKEIIDFVLETEGLKNKFAILREIVEIVVFTELKDGIRKLVLVFEIDLNNIKKNERIFVEISKFCFMFVDSINDYKPSKQIYDELVKRRLELTGQAPAAQQPNESSQSNENADASQTKSRPGKDLTYVGNNSGISKSSAKKAMKSNRVKQSWNDEGIYAFTNSRCSELKPKSFFFK